MSFFTLVGIAAAAPGSQGPACEAHSFGRPWRGWLECGKPLPPHPRLWPRVTRIYGTQETDDALARAADFLERCDPGGPPAEILDISVEGGGPIRGEHLSHQSGRDVDVGYFSLDDSAERSPYADTPPEELDARRTWAYLHGLIRTGRVQRIFVDYSLQPLLRREAEREGLSGLDRIFQYPRMPWVRSGLIRHWRNHRSHFHVRFRCPESDVDCRG